MLHSKELSMVYPESESRVLWEPILPCFTTLVSQTPSDHCFFSMFLAKIDKVSELGDLTSPFFKKRGPKMRFQSSFNSVVSFAQNSLGPSKHQQGWAAPGDGNSGPKDPKAQNSRDVPCGVIMPITACRRITHLVRWFSQQETSMASLGDFPVSHVWLPEGDPKLHEIRNLQRLTNLFWRTC